jgi:hypothetical protein
MYTSMLVHALSSKLNNQQRHRAYMRSQASSTAGNCMMLTSCASREFDSTGHVGMTGVVKLA